MNLRRWTLVFASLLVAQTQVAAQGQSVSVFDAAWRIVDREHFDRDHNGVDWDAVREELRPRAAEVDSESELRALIGEMLGRLGQSHFSLIPREALGPGGSGSLPGTCGFDLRWIEGQALVTDVEPGSPAAEAGVRRGWELVGVDGESVGAILDEPSTKPFLRPEAQAWVVLKHKIDGRVGEAVTLRFADGRGERTSLELERVQRRGIPFDLQGLPTFYLTLETQALLNEQMVGVVRFSNWFRPIVERLHEELLRLRGCDGIVIDLRGNTGGDGSVARALASHFFTQRTSLGVQRMRNGDSQQTVRPIRRFRGEPVEPYEGPVAVLIDETTGSCSEVFTGGMQAHGRVRVFGSRSTGAALPSHLSELPNGDYLLHAIADFITVRGESMEGTGVVPDEAVRLTRQDLLAGRDPVLEAAARWIRGESAQSPNVIAR